MNGNQLFIAKTQYGFEELLAGELQQAGASDIQLLTRAVSFRGSLEVMYTANYTCRTALHILMPVLDFKFRDKEQFFELIKKFDWAQYFLADKTFSIDTVMSDSFFTNSHYVSLLCKDAIADHFRDRYNRRPSVELENPDIRIHVHIRGHECSVSFDSSGGSLHRRGYRLMQGLAPMSEVLAAGMVLLSGWDKKTNLFDPMCGSATILTEAAMIAGNIPAGYYRKSFGFEKWNNFDENLWQQVKENADAKIIESECEITGADISESAIDAASKNLRSARLHKDIHLTECDFRDFRFPPEKGMIITNPPYGERIKPEDIIRLYKDIGDTLKRHCAGYEAWVISSHFDALKFIGLKPGKKVTLFNGPLECRFVKFEVFQGSLKDEKSRENKAHRNDR
ncbi:MAG TPA: THUMP domain-containing protein [Bacteroidales bacterium]|nr:THUMP domain-containing protein [Bacteroidales bacterium]